MLSAATEHSSVTPAAELADWLARRTVAGRARISRIPFAEATGWAFDVRSGNLAHASGRFFSVEGISVRTDRQWISSWIQPIIVQAEIGILGILVKEFDGVLHCLMQTKMEPGNVNTVQLSPTVQATRSNYLGVHRGKHVDYLDYFTGARGGRVLVDVLQSEQGAWFLHKRNRNMVVETEEDVPVGDDYRWLTFGQIKQLLQRDNVVNMDSRTVISCVPAVGFEAPDGDGTFAGSLLQSLAGNTSALHSGSDILSWLTEIRATRDLVQRRIPLNDTVQGGWYRDDVQIAHESGRYFKVVAVSVEASSREVSGWRQPLVEPNNPGLTAFLTKRVNGVLHVLMQARVDAGSLNGAELAPTVHCQPDNYAHYPERYRPSYLDYVLTVDPRRIRYDVMQSEEGGRFLHAQNRNVVIDVGDDIPVEAPYGYRWMTLNQLGVLLMHSNYLNVEARSLLACMRTLW